MSCSCSFKRRAHIIGLKQKLTSCLLQASPTITCLYFCAIEQFYVTTVQTWAQRQYKWSVQQLYLKDKDPGKHVREHPYKSLHTVVEGCLAHMCGVTLGLSSFLKLILSGIAGLDFVSFLVQKMHRSLFLACTNIWFEFFPRFFFFFLCGCASKYMMLVFLLKKRQRENDPIPVYNIVMY